MDVINPSITVIGKRYYRNNIILQRSQELEEKDSNISCSYDEEFCDYEEFGSIYPILPDGNGFSCNLSIASMFYGFIIGKNSQNKKRIELETRTTITIPKQGGCDDMVIVRGNSESGVDRAVSRIIESVDLARRKSPFTHFFSIAANSSELIAAQFNSFKTEVLHQCMGDHGVDERLFQKPYKLHLTLSLLVLGDRKEVENATKEFLQFQNLHRDLFSRPLQVHIRGLEYMNDDPCETRVLYGKVDRDILDGEKLQTLADKLTDFLFEHRLNTKKETGSVILHMTLLNVSFLSERDSALDTVSENMNKKSFDCSNILKRFSNWDFGVLEVKEICLSKRHAAAQNEYYPSAATFKFG